MSSGKSSSGQQDFYGHCAGIVCQGQLDFIWGLMVNNAVVWPPNLVLWDSKAYAVGAFVIWTDGNCYKAIAKATQDPPAYPWELYAQPYDAGHAYAKGDPALANGNLWTAAAAVTGTAPPVVTVWAAGTFVSGSNVIFSGLLWTATADTSQPPPKSLIEYLLLVAEAALGGPSCDWLPLASVSWTFLCTPVTWSSARKFWTANSIVAWEGRVYTTPSATSAEPPAAPWVLWKTDRASSANPLKFTIPNDGNNQGGGDCYLYWGTEDQTLDAANEQILSNLGHPPYRNRAVFVLHDFLFGTMQTTPPDIVVLGGRSPVQSLIINNTAVVGVDATAMDADWQVNPWCVLAELLTHPIYGLGLPVSWFDATTWQAEADRCAAHPELYYISPIYTSLQKVRSLVSDLLGYPDAFIFRSILATLTAGHWPHGENAPVFTDANTVNRDDVTKPFEWDSDGWDGTASAVALSFQDIQAGFKNRPMLAPNLFNTQIIKRLQSQTVDRPYIVRADQAAAWATEFAKLAGDRALKGSGLTVRAEKADSIQPGSIFLLTDDALGISSVQRCTKRIVSGPPSGTVILSHQTEKGISPQPFSPTPLNPGVSLEVPPTRLTDFQLVEMPDLLNPDGNSYRMTCLAARGDENTLSTELWWQNTDTTAFELLATITRFSVAALMNASINGADVANEVITVSSVENDSYNLANQDVWNLSLQYSADGTAWTDGVEDTDFVCDYQNGNITILGGAGIADGDHVRVSYSIYANFTLVINTPTSDIEAISAALTADEIANNKLLLFAFNVSDPTKSEILGVKSIEAVGSGAYRASVRRQQYETLTGGDGAHVWTASDRVFISFRETLPVIEHLAFPALMDGGNTAMFRLSPATNWEQADVDDVFDAGQNPAGLTTQFAFDFFNPYTASATWKILNVNGAPITDFTSVFQTTDEFEFTVQFASPQGTLSGARLLARLGDIELLLWSQVFNSSMGVGVVSFKLPTPGTWEIVAVVYDQSNRILEQPLVALGGADEVFIQIEAAGEVTTPTAHFAGVASSVITVTLSDATAGSTILYQVVDLYAAPGGSWLTYSAFFRVSRRRTIYAKATASGLTDSAVVAWNFP